MQKIKGSRLEPGVFIRFHPSGDVYIVKEKGPLDEIGVIVAPWCRHTPDSGVAQREHKYMHKDHEVWRLDPPEVEAHRPHHRESPPTKER